MLKEIVGEKDVKPLTDEQREFLARQKEYMKSITYEYKR